MRNKTKKVWHPESSVASYDGCEEGGRGSTAPSKPGSAEVKRKRAIIPRRRVPTVDVRHVAKVAGLQCSSGEETLRKGQTYSTIEETGHPTLLDCATEPARRLRNERVHCPDFCGWLEDESLEKYSFGKVVSMSMDRTSLQTPADHGSRLQSRAGSRYSNARRNHYEFKHFLDCAHEYIEHYRTFYCYTTVTAPPQVASTVFEDDTPQDLFYPGVKSLYQSDPYLRELASRLGVRESIREQQLLQSPRPTPPSIVKRRKEREDLIICANGKKEEDISQKDKTLNLTQNPPKIHASVNSYDTKPASVELPRITQTAHTRHPNISNISITKYLQVTSHHQTNFTKQKETADTGPSSQHTLPYSSVSDSSLSGEISEHLQNDASGSSMQEDLPHPINIQVFLKDHLPPVDEVQKEKIISSKAHALGLLSRDWAKTPHIRRMMGTQFAHEFTNAPYTDCTPTGARKTNQECTGSDVKPSHKNPHRQTSREKPKTKGSSKIERLRSIYEPAELSKRKKMGPRLSSRLLSTKNHSRCVSRAFSRPATRFSQRDPMEDIKGIYSRPVTRFSRSQRPESRANKQVTITKEREQEVESLEEDSYWNELPISIQTQPTTTIKQKRPENTNATPSSPTRQVHMHKTSRPPTRADSRLYSCGNLTTRLRKRSQSGSTLQQTAEHQVRKFMVG